MPNICKKFKKRYRKGYKKRIRRFVNFFILLFSRLVPRSSRLVIFGAGKGKLFSDNPKYLFYKAVDDPAVEAVWVTKSKKLYEKLKSDDIPCTYAFSREGKKIQLKAAAAVCSYGVYSDLRGYLLGGAHVINLWHGVGLKKVNYAHKKSLNYKRYYHKNPLVRFINRSMIKLGQFKSYYLISTSPSVSAYYPETFLVKPENVMELGQARNDVFFDDNLVDESMLPEALRENKKIITYMPTHRKDGKTSLDIDSVFDIEALNDFCQANGYLFLIKTHFYSKNLDLDQYKSIYNFGATEIDPQVLLKYTDILITDYSSCYTDFLLLDRPIIFYCYDYDWYITSDRDLYHNYDDVTPGCKCFNFSDLLSALKDAAGGKDPFVEERARVLDIFYSEPNRGLTAGKQWSFIKSLLCLEAKERSSL